MLKTVKINTLTQTQIYAGYRKDFYDQSVITRYCINLVNGSIYFSIGILAASTKDYLALFGYGFAAGLYYEGINDKYREEIELGKMKICKNLPNELQEINEELRKDTGEELVWILLEKLDNKSQETNRKD